MAVLVDLKKCTGCGDCVDICPTEAIKIIDDKAVIGEECVDCESCIDECPNEALSME